VSAVFGRPGASLEVGQSWAKNDAVIKHGAAAERRTAELLDTLPDRFAVFHDLRVPTNKITANIDHAVLVGKHLILIDTKAWAGGTYWSFRGTNRRGLKRVDHISKKTMLIAESSMKAAFTNLGVTVHQPLIAVWPSSSRSAVKLINPFVPASRVIHAAALPALVQRMVGRRDKSADPALVNALKKLLLQA
jgi:hypothetical protein